MNTNRNRRRVWTVILTVSFIVGVLTIGVISFLIHPSEGANYETYKGIYGNTAEYESRTIHQGDVLVLEGSPRQLRLNNRQWRYGPEAQGYDRLSPENAIQIVAVDATGTHKTEDLTIPFLHRYFEDGEDGKDGKWIEDYYGDIKLSRNWGGEVLHILKCHMNGDQIDLTYSVDKSPPQSVRL